MPGPLAGIRVIEMAGLAPGPFGCMMLADLGADVLRIERAGGGGLVPPEGPLDRGKYSLSLDVKNPADLEKLLALCDNADVFVEGFRPGVAERIGIGPEDLHARNPRLIYGRITGWGQDGPLAPRAGHDINYAAISGALDLLGREGEKPTPPVNLLADFAGGGMLLALGVLAALHERNSSNKGQVIDAAMVDGAALMTTFLHGMHDAGLWNGARGTNLLDTGAACYDTYETADGKYMAVGALEPQFHAALIEKLELDADELPFHLDPTGWPQWRETLTNAFVRRTQAEWAEIFEGSDACVSPVLSAWDAHEHPHNKARETFVSIGGVQQPAPAPRFSRTALSTPHEPGKQPPAEYLQSWGLTEE
ncbi:CoA transferase [Hoyosella rhizosphaerae]|uniref:CoA transferase n=1 Tax=Hoyosella rhizosphaerae TaxID=1755582 RepID=A0A916UL44_9ACTN|nr:CaiB/BaiF CoA-transferase family protein [Hoyosella rhizosphaerae]MBN4925259.1 CoA transferase [Hoyosella rhizosphaerae]GGC76699.1 CoA transferase [Hoyosella rhizosphaerae]